ncbi:MAG: HNH endonuclease [Spirochaetes bacterium]|nr:MAG: HNH endonuclease [Spirochaetota bacterium]
MQSLVKCKKPSCSKSFEQSRKNKVYCSRHCKTTHKTNRSKGRKKKPYTIFKKDYCENCKFVPIHPCQLDVDHIDGDHSNNELSNLRTLCANCHRLKTFMNKDWEKFKE